MRTEIRLAGFGGQGIVLAGLIIGKAASIFAGKYSTMTQNYGPEARGGACHADIVISDEKIEYPIVVSPNVIIALSQEAYNIYDEERKEEPVELIDSDLVKAGKGKKIFAIPATSIAEKFGRRMIANMVMLGFFTAVTDLVSYKAMKKSILTSVPKGTQELNIDAFDEGYEYAKKIEKHI